MADQPAIIQGYTPTVIDKFLHVTQDGYQGVVRYHNRNANVGIRAIVIHVQEGSNWGSWQHFHSVKASSTVFVGKAGDIWNLVPENKAPWTNGDVNKPDAAATALMNRYGWDPNTWCLTIESEGFSGYLPYTDAQFKSIAWQVYTWLTAYPTIEAVHILRHGQINSVTRPRCPEPAPYPMMQRLLKELANVATVPENPTTTIRPAWPVLNADGSRWDGSANITINGTMFYGEPRRVSILTQTQRRQWASSVSNLTGDDLMPGETANVLGWVEGEEINGERRWWIGSGGSRFWVGATKEAPSAPAPQPTKPDDGLSNPDYGNNVPGVPVVLNGNTYYAIEQKGEIAGMVGEALENANVRLWAATHTGSPVQRTLAKGQRLRVIRWVNGETVTQTVDGESETSDRWYVIGDDDAAITKGGRIWAPLVKEVAD